MSKLNVYLSSPYLEFKEIRDSFLNEIKSRNYLYEITAMEYYRAEDINALKKCIDDVNKCHIYVLILGDQYGSLAKKSGVDTGKSFTYWEYDTANKRKTGLEKLILIKAGSAANKDPLLAEWLTEIANSQILTVYYNDQSEIPKKILESLDNFTSKRLQSSIEKKDLLHDKIYLCDRSETNQEFLNSLDEKPLQFFILNGHENDLPRYFVKRKEIEYEDMDFKVKDITIKPRIPNNVIEFEKAEMYIKSELFTQLKWRKFRLPKDVTPESIICYMDENKIDYLSVSWMIERSLWKNDNLKKIILEFHKKWSAANKTLQSKKQILIFGILQYTENEETTEDEFYQRVQDIRWDNNPLKLTKINKNDIKDWLEQNGIEDLETRKEEIISLYLKDLYARDLYFKEAESSLTKILDLYNN